MDTMTHEEHAEWCNRRNSWYVEHYYPFIERRLKEGANPKEIAVEMSSQGYQGFNSNRIGVDDVKRIIELNLRAK